MTTRSLAALLLLAGAACGAPAGRLHQCREAADCPASANECLTPTCGAWACEYNLVPAGTRVGVQPDCQVRFCDASGVVQLVFEAALCQPTVDAAEVLTSPVVPDSPVVVHGVHLAGATVTVNGQPVPAVAAPDGLSVSFTAPPRPPYTYIVTLTTAYGSTTHDLTYVLRRTSGVTLVADGWLGDWPLQYAVAWQSQATSWSSSDSLVELFAAYDANGLWIGVAGGTATTPANGLVIYLDSNIGGHGAQGVLDMSVLTDNASPLSDACSSVVTVDPSLGLRPQACAGTVGMRSAGPRLWPSDAGIRSIYPNTATFGWGFDPYNGNVAVVTAVTAPQPGVELFLPWITLGLAPQPPAGTVVGLAAVIVSPDGLSVSNQFLPPSVVPGRITDYVPVLIAW